MAIIWESIVPPSMQQRFAGIITVIKPQQLGYRPARRNSQSLSPSKRDPRGWDLKAASEGAEWMTNRYVGYGVGQSWRDFKYLRQREILQGIFNPLYWQLLVNNQNTMIKDQPTCALATSQASPPFNDPDRQRSFCQDYMVVDQYDKSLAVDGSARPGYGWGGSVNNKIWSDDYSVIEIASFAIPVEMRNAEGAPLYFKITIDYDISATIRGNKMWPSIAVTGRPRFPPHVSSKIGHEIQHFARSRFRFKGTAPPDSLPYQWVLQREWIIPYEWAIKFPFTQNTRWIDLYVVPVVPFGRYFSNNDSVVCKGNVSVEAFAVITP